MSSANDASNTSDPTRFQVQVTGGRGRFSGREMGASGFDGEGWLCPNAEVGARWMDTDGSLEHVISPAEFNLE